MRHSPQRPRETLNESAIPAIHVTEVRLTRATARDRRSGLEGWLAFVVGGWLKIDGATLRRTRAGRLAIGYPAREDSNGVRHYLVHPIYDDARREVERQVIAVIADELSP